MSSMRIPKKINSLCMTHVAILVVGIDDVSLECLLLGGSSF